MSTEMPGIDPLAEENVFSGLRDILAHSLGLDDEDVTRDARICADLGADPFDILYITWRIRKEFALTSSKNGGNPIAMNAIGDMSVDDLGYKILEAMLG